jgi:site-specific DNA-methyltransferase (adenine-specific)
MDGFDEKRYEVILDTHVGSGSSLIACENMGFEYVGCEIDKEYYDKACERILKFRKENKKEYEY